jgi:hypothetical protein
MTKQHANVLLSFGFRNSFGLRHSAFVIYTAAPLLTLKAFGLDWTQ